VCTGIVSTGSEGIKQHEIITIRRKQGWGLMETDVRLWSNYESSGWGWMPRCPSQQLMGPIGIQSRVIRVVQTVHGQDETTLKDAKGCDE